MAYRYGDRCQQTLFPQSIDEYVPQNAPVRAYDVIIGSIDFDKLNPFSLPSRGVGPPAIETEETVVTRQIVFVELEVAYADAAADFILTAMREVPV